MRLGDYQCRDRHHKPVVIFIWCTGEEYETLPGPKVMTDMRDSCNNEVLAEVKSTTPNLVALTMLGLDVRAWRNHDCAHPQ